MCAYILQSCGSDCITCLYTVMLKPLCFMYCTVCRKSDCVLGCMYCHCLCMHNDSHVLYSRLKELNYVCARLSSSRVKGNW